MMTWRFPIRSGPVLIVGLALALPGLAKAADVGPLLARIKAVGREGAGNAEAARAVQELSRLGPDALIDILTGLDGADPIAANWIRAAVDVIAGRELAGRRQLPAARFEAFVLDRKHQGAARRLAYELLVQVDPTAPGRLLPGMLDDPSIELRRDAVAVLIDRADQFLEKQDKPGAAETFRKAFAAARDRDQVDRIAKQLQSLGVEVNLAAHFGFITQWRLAAPFDNTKGIGFEVVYPPEKGVDLKSRYKGKNGLDVSWKEHASAHAYGLVDLNKVIGKHMGVVGYAYAAVESPEERPVQVRAGTKNAVKIYLNGKQIFFREEYHHGMRMDQHVAEGILKKGRNEILIKVCQNEQTESWAQEWEFQVRVCDAVGTAVPVKVLREGPAAEGRKQE